MTRETAGNSHPFLGGLNLCQDRLVVELVHLSFHRVTLDNSGDGVRFEFPGRHPLSWH